MNSDLAALLEFVAIPSVSTDPGQRRDMERAVDWLLAWAQRNGFRGERWDTPGHPAVYVETAPRPGQPVLLIYGHYDVQPAEDRQLWRRPPFEPHIEDDRLYGRGASDNKGQIWAHCSALAALGAELPIQVKLLIEGEEEIGSVHLPQLLTAQRERLAADIVLVSDTSTAVKGLPTLHYSLRGIVIFEVQVQVAARDVHSGVFGGTSPNAVHQLARLIARMHDEQGRVTIPGFYDGVRPIEAWEKEMLERVPFDADFYRNFIGCRELAGEAGYSTNERRWFRPTLDCNGCGGGFQGAGSKTIVPARAMAKFSARLVPDQRPEQVLKLCRDWVLAQQEWVGEIEFLGGEGGPPYFLDPRGPAAPYLQKARQALQRHFGEEPLLLRHGGAIPIVSQFETILGLQTILMGFGSPDDAIHSPNEKFELRNFRLGIEASKDFIRSLAV